MYIDNTHLVEIRWSKGLLWVQATSDTTGVVHIVRQFEHGQEHKRTPYREKHKKSDGPEIRKSGKLTLPEVRLVLQEGRPPTVQMSVQVEKWQHIRWDLAQQGFDFFRLFDCVIPHTGYSLACVKQAQCQWERRLNLSVVQSRFGANTDGSDVKLVEPGVTLGNDVFDEMQADLFARLADEAEQKGRGGK